MGNDNSTSKINLNLNAEDFEHKIREINSYSMSDLFLKKTGYLVKFSLSQNPISQIFHSYPDVKSELVSITIIFLITYT